MRLDERQVELIQADIDGELAGADRAELSALLLANPRARKLRDDLRAVCAALDAVHPEEAPVGLRDKVLAALPAEHQQEGQTTHPWHRGSIRFFSPLRLRYAAAFAGGLLVSALAFQISKDPGTGDAAIDELVGTMARVAPGAVDPQIGARLVDKSTIDMPNVSAVVSLYGTSAAPVIGVSVLTRTDVQVIARLEDQEIRFSGFDTTAREPDVRLGAFKHERDGGASRVELQVVDAATGNVLQSSTLKFDKTR